MLEILIDPFHRVRLSAIGDHVRAMATIGGQSWILGETEGDKHAMLEIRTCPWPDAIGIPRQGPDLIVAGVRVGTDFREVGRLDGRYLSTEVAGGFTGRMIGVSTTLHSEIKSFVYSGTDDPAAFERSCDMAQAAPTPNSG